MTLIPLLNIVIWIVGRRVLMGRRVRWIGFHGFRHRGGRRKRIGASEAIPTLVSQLINGSSRGKKDALTTLYKLCSVKLNKERVVSTGAVKPLVDLVAEQGTGLTEKAMVLLNSLAGIQEGKDAIVEEGGIAALVEAIEDGPVKGKEFAVLNTLAALY